MKKILYLVTISLLVLAGCGTEKVSTQNKGEGNDTLLDNGNAGHNIDDEYTNVELVYTDIYNDYVWIKYLKSDVSYTGILNSKGEITFETSEKIEVGVDNNNNNFTQEGNTFYITEDKVVHIIDKNGTELFNNNKNLFTSIVAVGDNAFFVRKDVTDYSSNISYFGTLDKNGDWIRELKPVTCGEETISDTDTGEVVDMGENCYFMHFGQYKNMVYSMEKGFIWSKDIDVRNYHSKFFDKKVLILGNGSLTAFWLETSGKISEADWPDIGGSADYKEGLIFEGNRFYDCTGKAVIDFSQFNDVSTNGFEEKYAEIGFEGKDGNRYYAVIDKKGDFVVEPKQVVTKKNSEGDEKEYVLEYAHNKVCYVQNDTWKVFDIETKETVDTGVGLDYSSVRIGNNMLFFLSDKGGKITDLNGNNLL